MSMSFYSGALSWIERWEAPKWSHSPAGYVALCDVAPEKLKHFADGNRENITVIDCICADGTVLPPFIVMKGKRPSYSWVKDSELEKAWIAASPNGWTDNELGVHWAEKIFEPETREK